ncbi:aminotransferase [Tricladium varicosporioides]|nr:aminotransferase [Hymenoscyphus varicosporioides]
MEPKPDFQLFSSLRYDPLLCTLPINTETWESDIKAPSPFYMLPYHRDRMLQAAEHFGWTTAADKIRGPEGFKHLLEKLNEAIDASTTTPMRVRTLLNYDGSIIVEPSPVPPLSIFNLYPTRIPSPKASQPEVKVSPLTGGALSVGASDAIHGDPPRDEPFIVLPDTNKTAPSPFTSYKTTSRAIYMSGRERVGIQDMAEKKEVLILSTKDGEIMEGSLTSPYFWRDGKWVTPNIASGGQIGTTRRWALGKGFCVEGIITADSLIDGEECWISNGVRGFAPGIVKLS